MKDGEDVFLLKEVLPKEMMNTGDVI